MTRETFDKLEALFADAYELGRCHERNAHVPGNSERVDDGWGEAVLQAVRLLDGLGRQEPFRIVEPEKIHGRF